MTTVASVEPTTPWWDKMDRDWSYTGPARYSHQRWGVTCTSPVVNETTLQSDDGTWVTSFQCVDCEYASENFGAVFSHRKAHKTKLKAERLQSLGAAGVGVAGGRTLPSGTQETRESAPLWPGLSRAQEDERREELIRKGLAKKAAYVEAVSKKAAAKNAKSLTHIEEVLQLIISEGIANGMQAEYRAQQLANARLLQENDRLTEENEKVRPLLQMLNDALKRPVTK